MLATDVMKGTPVIALDLFCVKHELVENYDELSEDQKRLAIRAEMKRHNKQLADAAHGAGVETPKEYAIFQNYGYGVWA